MTHPMDGDIFIDKKPPRSLLRLGHEIRLGQIGKKKTGSNDAENQFPYHPCMVYLPIFG